MLSDLDVLLCDEPGPVSQKFVERLQAAQLAGGLLQAAQPALLPSSLQEASAVLLHQVQALVSSRGLPEENTKPPSIYTMHRLFRTLSRYFFAPPRLLTLRYF